MAATSMSDFSYSEFTKRNVGFVTEAEQERLRASSVFVCGTGGMGGACILALARAGIGDLLIADIDDFELSNLNRQVFAFTDTIGQQKAEATAAICKTINPTMSISVYKDDWTEHVDELIDKSAVIVNGTDDLAAGLLLYRQARAGNKAVVDAYASPLPSMFLTHPTDPMPEERLGYPTRDTHWNEVSDEQRRSAFLREVEHVLINSSSRHYVDPELAGRFAAGEAERMSFAPMVITTGMLMAYEVIQVILKRPTKTNYQGWFFNPYKARAEHPRHPWIAAMLRPIVRRYIDRLTA